MEDLLLVLDLNAEDSIECLSIKSKATNKKLALSDKENFKNLENFKIPLIIANSGIRFMRLEVPPANKSQLKKIIPNLLQDITLGDLSDYHLTYADRDADGYVLVSITPKSSIKKSLSLLQENSIILKSITPIESIVSSNVGEGYLVSFKDSCFINFDNKWRWNSDEKTITSFIKEGLIEFNISKISLYQEDKSKRGFENESIIIKSFTDFIRLNTKNLSFESNLLTGEFLPKVLWSKIFKKWYIPILSIFIIFLLQLVTISTNAFKNESLVSNLNQLSISSYQALYPNEPLSRNVTRQIKKKLESLPNLGSERFIDTFFTSSEILAQNPNASIFAINFDKQNNLFLLEIECTEYENLEEIKSKFIERGYEIETGSSRRSGGSIFSEIVIKKI